MLRPDQIAQLDGLPPQWRFALTGGSDDSKRCFEENWNAPGNGRTADSVRQLIGSPTAMERWKMRKTLGVGVITGEESGGLLVIDFDGTGSEAARTFRRHFRHYPSELPRTLVNISGKKGRAKVYFRVSPHLWPQFANRSATWHNADGAVVMEAIWANTSGNWRHAVIIGDHPESSHQQPLYYRWLDGCGPSDCGVAEAPEWLTDGILAQFELKSATKPTLQEKLRSGEDDATPWERLSAWERFQLVAEALPYCPNRLEKGSGTYEKARRILCGILNEFGLEIATHLVTTNEWETRNEWPTGSSAAATLESLAKTAIADDAKARIASVFHFAREAGWMPPRWATPPVEVKVQVEELKKLINQMLKEESDKTFGAMLLGKVKKEYGIDPQVFRRLALEHFLGTSDQKSARTLLEIKSNRRKDNEEGDVIDGFLSRRVHVLAGASHSGKTTLASFFANRVVYGLPLDIDDMRHSTTKKGKVLIFTSDCSDHDMLKELALEGVDPENVGEQVRVCSGTTFDDMLFIVKQLDEYQPDLVVYDCLTSMACKDVAIGDPSYADPIRLLVRHNGVAWPRCCHLILHHTTRDEPARFSGSEQIKAACDELYLYYPPELLKWRKGQPRPVVGSTRHLVLEKSRTGYAGRSLAVSRNAYQGTWQWQSPDSQDASPLEKLTHAFRKVQHDEWRIASEWHRELDLQFKDRTLRRYLDQLVGTVLESQRMYSKVTHRPDDTHYRPTRAIRFAAQQMISSRGDGVNEV